MTDLTPAAGRPAADLFPALPARWGGWAGAVDERTLEHERLEHRARGTDATAQLLRCLPRWSRALEQLTARALERLARNAPVDPNDADVWRSRDAHAQAVLYRHRRGTVSATRLTSTAITALIDGQAHADYDAGLDWSIVTSPASRWTSDCAGRTGGCRSRSRIRPCGRTRSTSGARSPRGSASTSAGGRSVALGAGQPRRVRPDRSALLADRLRLLARARRRAARTGRQGRSAGRRVRRAGARGERRVAAGAGARARDDPLGR